MGRSWRRHGRRVINYSIEIRLSAYSWLENKTSTRGMITMGKVVTVTSGKGGVGKTTATANVAAALAATGEKVVCIDADIGKICCDFKLLFRI
jgi:polynucleotide 5'-kinase involved in rRNA processing